MFIIGELINSTRKAIAQAIEQKDEGYLKDLARRQANSGASAIDINAAASSNEIENMKWLVNLVQEVVDVPLCIDSPSAEALAIGLEHCKGRAVINSITAEKERWAEVLPLVQQFKSKVVALCMDNRGMPETVSDRLRVADVLVNGLTAAGVSPDDIYLDPLLKPLGVNHLYGLEALDSTRQLHERFPSVHIVSGLSNISFGLPERKLINRTFMVMSVFAGMDAFILDPLDQQIMAQLAAAKVLAGQDEYCMDYITGVRSGQVKA